MFAFVVAFCGAAFSCNANVIITQVYEGASNNKYVEITNVGSSSVDLATAGLKLAIWSISGSSGNGTVSGNPSNSISLSGNLAAGASMILKNGSAALPTYANSAGISNAAVNFNGDDAIALITGASTIVDLFGVGINNLDVNYSRNTSATSPSTTFNVADWTQTTIASVDGAVAGTIHYLGFWPVTASSSPAISGINPEAAASGANVTLTGQNLANPTSVTFPSAGGPVSATVVSSSSTEIVTTVPPAATSGLITVTTPNGSATAAFRSLNPISLPYGPENFEVGQGAWFTFSAASNRNWSRNSTISPANLFMEINPFGGDVASNDWLIVGPFNFPTGVNLSAIFDVQRAFNGDESEVELKYSTNYSGLGNPNSATWTVIPFAKPATVSSSSTVFQSSGATSLPSTLEGQSGVYLAFHAVGGTTTPVSRWRIDNFELLSSTLPLITITSSAGSINEGEFTEGTVTIPTALPNDLVVTVSSADGSEILVDGDGLGFATSTQVTILSGNTSATFSIQGQLDGIVDSDETVQVTAEATGYEFGQVEILVLNIDLESEPLTNAGYSQDFSTFNSLLSIPSGWSATGPDLSYDGDWGTGDSGGFRGNNSVFGYQHTGSTETVQQVLTLRNETGSMITDLTISYRGRVERATEPRSPSYTVTVNGLPFGGLAYSTSDGDNVLVSESISGLSIAENEIITIVWESTRGGGSGGSKQIGISQVQVSAGASQFPPGVSGLSIPPLTISEEGAQVSAQVTTDGGSPITARGFVYSLTTENAAPEIGGTNVTAISDAANEVGTFLANLTGLQSGSEYSIRAYATNAEGTSYTGVQTFSTLDPPTSFVANYTDNFDNFDGNLPASWTAISTGAVMSYIGDFGTGSSGGFLGGEAAPGVLGYQHTGTTGDLVVTLRLVNNTGAEISQLNVSYLGRVGRADQTRTPAWVVSVDGVEVPELAYSTGNTQGTGGAPADLTISSTVSGLSIPDGEEFTITWVSNRGLEGTGSSRQIGLANVMISLPSSGAPVISGGLTITGTVGVPIEPYQIIASGSPISFGSAALPSGLSLDTATGIISGTPTQATAGAAVEISATNSSGTGTAELTITVAKASTIIVQPPSASDILRGETLGDSILSGGSASVPGSFAFTNPGTQPPVGTNNYEVTFTPTDSSNYLPATVQVPVSVLGFLGWSGGLTPTAELVEEYAIGGVTSPGGDREETVTAVEGENLTLTAVVRVDDPNLTVVGEETDNLANAFTSTEVAVETLADQTGVPAGFERRKYSVPFTGNRQFLRLNAVLATP